MTTMETRGRQKAPPNTQRRSQMWHEVGLFVVIFTVSAALIRPSLNGRLRSVEPYLCGSWSSAAVMVVVLACRTPILPSSSRCRAVAPDTASEGTSTR